MKEITLVNDKTLPVKEICRMYWKHSIVHFFKLNKRVKKNENGIYEKALKIKTIEEKTGKMRENKTNDEIVV